MTNRSTLSHDSVCIQGALVVTLAMLLRLINCRFIIIFFSPTSTEPQAYHRTKQGIIATASNRSQKC